jgi:hypothetical protein
VRTDERLERPRDIDKGQIRHDRKLTHETRCPAETRVRAAGGRG